MLNYNLIEYTSSYAKTYRGLQKYRDKAVLNNVAIVGFISVDNSQFKQKITDQTNNGTKGVKIMVP